MQITNCMQIFILYQIFVSLLIINIIIMFIVVELRSFLLLPFFSLSLTLKQFLKLQIGSKRSFLEIDPERLTKLKNTMKAIRKFQLSEPRGAWGSTPRKKTYEGMGVNRVFLRSRHSEPFHGYTKVLAKRATGNLGAIALQEEFI
jgi:hypothetical protein